MSRRGASLVVVGIALAGLLGPAAPAGASFPGRNGLLAVVLNKGDIWTMSLAGKPIRRLTTTGNNYEPRWSPDGKRIAFESSRTGRKQVYTMNADGSAVTQVTTAASNQFEPNWSPDGKWLVFTSDREHRLDICNDPLYDVYKLRSTVPYGAAIQVTHETSTSTAYNPAWSSDGKTILLEVDPNYDCAESVFYPELHRLSVATGAETTINFPPGCEDSPDWAPSGKKIAFWATNNCPGGGNPGGPWNLYQSNPDGTGLVKMTHYTAGYSYPLGSPAWAPYGGASLVFAAGSAGPGCLFEINADGTGLRTIRTCTSFNGEVDWQPLP